MGMFTRNYYNLMKYQSYQFFLNNSTIASNVVPSYDVNNRPSVYFTSLSGDVTSYSPRNVNINYYAGVPYYSSNLISVKYSSYVANLSSFTKFISLAFPKIDFEESIDTQSFSTSEFESFSAISKTVTFNENGSSINLNFTRTTNTPLYGLFLYSYINLLSESTYTLYVTFIHKFDKPITDTSFTIQMSFNINNGEINVS